MSRFSLLLSVLFAATPVLSSAPKPVRTLEIGSRAPDFTLPGVDGRDYRLADFNDHKLLVVIFTCNHCPDAVAAQDRIKALAADYRDQGVGVVAISGNDPEALQLWELGWSVYGDSFEEKQQTSRVFGCSTKWSWKRELAVRKEKEWEALPVTVAPLDAATAKKLAANETEKLRLINVWSTTCGPCVAEFPDLVETYRRYQSRPFELITISTDPAGKAKAVEKFLRQQHAALPPRTAPSLEAEGRTTNNYHYASDDLDALADALDPDWQGPLPHTILLAPAERSSTATPDRSIRSSCAGPSSTSSRPANRAAPGPKESQPPY